MLQVTITRQQAEEQYRNLVALITDILGYDPIFDTVQEFVNTPRIKSYGEIIAFAETALDRYLEKAEAAQIHEYGMQRLAEKQYKKALLCARR